MNGIRWTGRHLAVRIAAALALTATSACTTIADDSPPAFDVVVRGGTVYDGSGGAPFVADVAISEDRIVSIEPRLDGRGRNEIDATGLAVAPGFINMLSWATESLIADGRAQSDIRQGVTLEVMGEGWSMGPLNDRMRSESIERQGDIRYPIEWTTLDEYLEHLESRGIAPNVASYVGATTVRIHVLGEGDVDPDAAQLDRMRALVREAMRDGALGVGSSLIYAPAAYAETPELIALVTEAAQCRGGYISHMRSEGDRIDEAIEELIAIAEASGARAEIYHLKLAGRDNWDRLDEVVARIEGARARGLAITADMYLYTAGATGLNATMPPWVQAGGHDAWVARLRDPALRARVIAEMRAPANGWENLLQLAGGADQVLLIGFRNPRLRDLTGKTLAEVARMRGTSVEDTIIDLVIEDDSRVDTAFFLMSEDNVRAQIALPWMSFGSDEAAPSTEGVFLQSNNHPRAYGNVARLLGRYVREEGIISLPEAIRRLTSLPAANLQLRGRGALREGYFADVVVFDPARVRDHSTFPEPHQYSTGVRDVLVNGVPVLSGGEPTGATPGRVVRGPGWTGWPDGGACNSAERQTQPR